MATARAAAGAGVPFALSTLASRRYSEVAAVGAVTWFQLYWLREPDRVAKLVATAEDLGCRALMLTVDVPIMGRRLRDTRNRFTLPPQVSAVNLAGAPAVHPASSGGSTVAAHTQQLLAPGLTWRDLTWLRRRTSLPLLVKGVLDPRDARRAVEVGADAVVVSNHGGRQCDAAVPSLRQLPAVVAAVAGRATVLLDSGIRSGTDVLRALALGAGGVLLGRPVLWGLASGGERGVAAALSLLRQELRDAMTLAGCACLADAAALGTADVPAP